MFKMAILAVPTFALLFGCRTMETYTNPVGGEIQMGDPFVLQVDKLYYLYGTTAPDGFKCWSSPDLVHWQSLGYVYQRNPDCWGTGAFWAPEATSYRGKFYLVYSCSRKGQPGFRLGLAVSDKPQGPFQDVSVPWIDLGWSTIDADLFIASNGVPYLYFARVDTPYPFPSATAPATQPSKRTQAIIYGVKLKEDLSAPAGEPVPCLWPTQPWEEPDPKFRSRCNEGPLVFQHHGLYYMTYSAGHYASSRYAIGCASAPGPLGPWTKSPANPLVSSHLDIGVSGPGHNSVVASPDGRELFMVYHAHADPHRPGGDRTVNIDRLTFDEQGNLRLLGPTRKPQPLPSGTENKR